MTTVLVLARSSRRSRVEGILRRAVLATLTCGLTATAQERPAHWLHAGAMPPGAIGSLRLHRGGPLSGYFQPVRIRAPQGARIALAAEGGFAESLPGDLLAGFQVGPVYRLRVSDVPNNEGLEVFPTVEVIDRLYPPPGLALRYPIPIELTQDELEMAMRGSFITRVIYIEDPHTALPVAQRPFSGAGGGEWSGGEQPWFEAAPGEDPLVAADMRGRPVAILRIGGRVPNAASAAARGAAPLPPYIIYDANVSVCPSDQDVPLHAVDVPAAAAARATPRDAESAR